MFFFLWNTCLISHLCSFRTVARYCEGFIPLGSLYSGARNPNSNGGISEAYHTMSASGMTLSCTYVQQCRKVRSTVGCIAFIFVKTVDPQNYGGNIVEQPYKYPTSFCVSP